MLDRPFWNGRRVLLTGHTGFKGGWAALWLKHAGAKVTGLALPPSTTPALFNLIEVGRDLDHRVADLRDRRAVADIVSDCRPQIVIHLAAQSLVLGGMREPVETIATNVLGTAHLLDALRSSPGLEAVLVITTDKVYENLESGRPFVETDRLGGRDPYAASKAATEIVTRAFAEAYFEATGVPVATARGGNVIGGGDFAAHRLVPDIVAAVHNGKPPLLRHPDATRPWQHVLDCLSGYFRFAAALANRETEVRSLNFGPESEIRISVGEFASAMLSALGASKTWHPDRESGPYEAEQLVLDASLARQTLGWADVLGAKEAIEWTAEWYRAFGSGANLHNMTLAQIQTYESHPKVIAANSPRGEIK